MSDLIRERNSRKRASSVLNHRPYIPNLYATPSILGRHIIDVSTLNIFSDTGRTKLYKLLRQLQEIPLTAKLTLDFSKLTEMKISAILMLYAHLEVFLRSRNKSRMLWRKPTDKVIDKKLDELGMWALFGDAYRPVQGAIKICSVSYEEKETDNKQSLIDAVEYVKKAIASYSSSEQQDDGDDAAFAAISESFTNVWQHAYAEDLKISYDTLGKLPIIKKWWIAVSHFDDQLFMAVYDIGVGIPSSTRRRPWYSRLQHDISNILSDRNSDCRDIQTALAYGSSRYNTQGRGNGLPAIKNFVETNPSGALYIISGKGIYNYNSINNSEQWTSLNTSYPGTLIQWNLALGNGRANSDEK